MSPSGGNRAGIRLQEPTGEAGAIFRRWKYVARCHFAELRHRFFCNVINVSVPLPPPLGSTLQSSGFERAQSQLLEALRGIRRQIVGRSDTHPSRFALFPRVAKPPANRILGHV